MSITKFFDALVALEKPDTPDFSDDNELNIYKNVVLPIDLEALRDMYREIRSLPKFPTFSKFKELAGYLPEDIQRIKVVNEWEKFLVTGKPMSFVANYYFTQAGGANRFRNMDTTAVNFVSRLRSILEAEWTCKGPKYPSERVKKADDKAYLPKWSREQSEGKEEQTERARKMMSAADRIEAMNAAKIKVYSKLIRSLNR